MAGLLGCWREAERAEDIAAALYRIRLEVDSLLLDDVEDVMAQVQFSSRLLRDLYDLSPIYKVRAHIIQEYLAVLLPCYKRTLQDIFHHLGDPALPFQQIWINLYNQLSIGDGVPLGDRFDIYNGFLIQLVLLLSRFNAFSSVIAPSGLTSHQTIDARCYRSRSTTDKDRAVQVATGKFRY